LFLKKLQSVLAHSANREPAVLLFMTQFDE
jgi:hypothetical protein